MMTKSQKPSRLSAALLETAADLRSGGLIGQAALEKITARHLGKDGGNPTVVSPAAKSM